MVRYTARVRTPADVGLALQQARLARGLAQTEVADEIGIPQSTVSQMESGQTTIYMRRLLEMARAIGMELSATWEDEDAPGS